MGEIREQKIGKTGGKKNEGYMEICKDMSVRT